MNSLFGTNGIRWIVDSDNIDFPVKLGLVAGAYFGHGTKVALGMDTRTSGPMIFNAVMSGLKASGCDVMDLGMLPTPALQFAVRELKLDGGIVVTASHNPPQFNGLKFIAGDGTELSREQEARFDSLYREEKLARAEWNHVGKHFCERHVHVKYREAIASRVNLARPIEAMVDCGNGASSEYTPDILTKLGCRVLTLNAQPDGRFPGRNPEPIKENIGSLMKAVKQHSSDLGIAHDGDADRATFVDEKGNYITGDQSLAIFAIDAVKRNGGGQVVVPINTSMTVLDVVTQNGGETVITPVGSPLIARTLMVKGGVLGGEGNGGIIFPEHQFCRDGMMTAAKMAEIVSKGGPASELVAALPKYCLEREKLAMPNSIKSRVLEKVRAEAHDEVLEIDGIKMVHDDHWVLVRASGTEPIVRITVETKSESQCHDLLRKHVQWVQEIIQGLS